ncbi:hypothetical protein THAOC_02943 [Thalassiosira oceanica]|uniref:Uncharacterized protein n=1 Tax=Thalassiosira oceanica TaxID=159749 RepID=K0TLI6_THAOC|nr:hypothetical protein THAOC_02943 [Thalassiosira oceanica]|eukprot:EJK75336.1 hypothetical protein THAOC_02943 [Thalassiosira oceanica]
MLEEPPRVEEPTTDSVIETDKLLPLHTDDVSSEEQTPMPPSQAKKIGTALFFGRHICQQNRAEHVQLPFGADSGIAPVHVDDDRTEIGQPPWFRQPNAHKPQGDQVHSAPEYMLPAQHPHWFECHAKPQSTDDGAAEKGLYPDDHAARKMDAGVGSLQDSTNKRWLDAGWGFGRGFGGSLLQSLRIHCHFLQRCVHRTKRCYPETDRGRIPKKQDDSSVPELNAQRDWSVVYYTDETRRGRTSAKLPVVDRIGLCRISRVRINDGVSFEPCYIPLHKYQFSAYNDRGGMSEKCLDELHRDVRRR